MNINKLIEKGEEAYKKKNFDYAISILMEAVQFSPNNRQARELLRKAALKKHEHAYPSGLAVAVFGLPAKFGMFFAGLGKKTNPEGYMLACEKFLRIDPKNRGVNVALGDAAALGGHVEAAIFAYETAAEHHSGDAGVLKKLGQLLWRAGKIDEAHTVYDRAVQVDPRDQEALKARKNLAAEASLKDTGFETAKSSQDLVRDKDAAGRLAQSERIYRTEGDLADQESRLEARLAEDKDNVELWQDLAELRQKQRNWDGAKEAMDQALRVNPTDLAIQFARDDLDISELEARELEAVQGHNEDEVASIQKRLLDVRSVAYRKRIEAYPTDLNLRFKLGDMLLQKHEIDDAIGQFQQTVKDPKFRSESQLRLGQAFAAKGQFDLAVRQLEHALEGQAGMNARVKEIRYNLGDVLERKGEKDKAKAQFGMIYETDIGYKDVSARLSKLASGDGAGTLSLDD